MILAEIKKYLMKNKRATLGDLACHFDIAPEAMKGMLEQWGRKGRVLKREGPAGFCNGCGKCCDAATMEIYEWIPYKNIGNREANPPSIRGGETEHPRQKEN